MSNGSELHVKVNPLLQPLSVKKGAGTYSAYIYDEIEKVNAAEWDSIISPDNIQSTHRFIKTCQGAKVENALYRHLMIYEGDKLVAVASLSLLMVSLDLLSSGVTRKIIRLARSLRSEFLRMPLLLCGLPVSFGNSCVCFKAGADSNQILEMITGVMNSFAQDAHASVLCFKEFTTDESTLLGYLTRFGYFRAPSLPGCSVAIAWRSFEDYLTSMRAGYRRQLIATLRARQEAGLTFRVMGDFGAECARIHQLYEGVMDRAEFQLERLNLTFFERLNVNLGQQSRAILMERKGDLLAAAIMLFTRRVATLLLVGINYELNRRYLSYFNIVVEAVKEAINAGVEILDLGQTSYDLKGRLGAVATERYIYLKHRKSWPSAILYTTSGFLFPVAEVSKRRVFKIGAN